MKKTIYTIFSIVTLLLMQSCRKNIDHVAKQVVIDTTLVSGNEYTLNLQPYGDADDAATISKQATNFTTSEIVNTNGIFAPVYHYSTAPKSTLNERVVLSISEGNHGNRGNCRNADSTIITINFTVK